MFRVSQRSGSKWIPFTSDPKLHVCSLWLSCTTAQAFTHRLLSPWYSLSVFEKQHKTTNGTKQKSCNPGAFSGPWFKHILTSHNSQSIAKTAASWNVLHSSSQPFLKDEGLHLLLYGRSWMMKKCRFNYATGFICRIDLTTSNFGGVVGLVQQSK